MGLAKTSKKEPKIVADSSAAPVAAIDAPSANDAGDAAKLPRMYYLYLIECKGKKLYCGIAVDVQARYELHRAGLAAKYTRAFPPIRLMASIACGNRSEAQKAEYAMKQLTAREKRAFIKRTGIAAVAA